MAHRAALGACLLSIAAATLVTISNIDPRVDTTGAILDAHDGDVLIVNGTYFWYAAGYGDCVERNSTTGCEGGFNGCGFLTNHSVNLFTSTDLVTWTSHGNVLPVANRPNATLFSPKAIYNAATQTYVLWYNFYPAYSYGVATSASPYGPFVTISNMTGASTQYGWPNNSHVGDFSLAKDPDTDAAYILYSSSGHCQIEPLTADYTASAYRTTGQTSGVFPRGFEAPALFSKEGTWYALISEACCYCQQGAPVHAFSSPNALGPYVYLGEIARGPNPWDPNSTAVATSAQQTNVFPVTSASDGTVTWMWQGDRWQSAPDGLKSHDFTYWTPLTFLQNGSIAHLQWENTFTVDV